MAEGPAYVILGRGRWAARMQSILAAEHRPVTSIEKTRRDSGESDIAYKSRLAEAMSASGARIAWLAVLPGPHVPLMIEAALDAGLHVVVEKPWQSSRLVTEMLATKAKSVHCLVAIHFEYCLLEKVESWRRDFHPGAGLRFGAHFFLNRPDHTGMSAMDNLGSHLLAIRMYAVPKSAIQEIRCGYEQPDERCVWLEKRNTRTAFIDLLANKEPIIQRFIAKVEASLDGEDFPLGLEFAMLVAKEAKAIA
ncbi:MAG: hypothetical protein WA639_03205 [Candidatus Acidiferrum sp.]